MQTPHSSKVAIVSGGTGYVGSAIACALARANFSVAVLYKTKGKGEVDALVSSMEGSGHRAYQCDIVDENSVSETIRNVQEEMGPIYACIHAAGELSKPKQLHMSSVSEAREQLEGPVFGSFNFLSVCAQTMKEHKEGAIIGITTASVVTSHNTKSRGAYGVAKFALQGILASLKEELASSGVRVYSIAPGVMAGGLNSATPKAFIDMVRATSASGKLASAEEVAGVAVELVRDTSYQHQFTTLVAPETDH